MTDRLTRQFRVLMDADTDPRALIKQWTGKAPFDWDMATTGIHGIAELDDEGVPVPEFAARDGETWDGWPREVTHWSLSMSLTMFGDPDLDKTAVFWQTVRVLQHGDGAPRIIAAETVRIHNGVPSSVSVLDDDDEWVYLSDGDWHLIDTRWTCTARREPASAHPEVERGVAGVVIDFPLDRRNTVPARPDERG